MYRKNRRMLTALALAVCTAFTPACSSGAGAAAPETTRRRSPRPRRKPRGGRTGCGINGGPGGAEPFLTMASGTNGGVFYMLAAAYSS